MNIFKKFFSGESGNTQSQPSAAEEAESKEQAAVNATVETDELADAIVRKLAAYPASKKEDNKGLDIWTRNAKTAEIIESGEFLSALRLALDNAQLNNLGERVIEIHTNRLADTSSGTPLEVKSWELEVTVRENRPRPQGTKATVRILKGHGSTQQEAYLLDSGKRTVWHIGRGEESTKGGGIRVNDIVIRTDEPDEGLQRQNNCVSSSHADIIAQDGRFFIKAMRSGCRPEGGSLTKIIRGEQTDELRDTLTLHPLLDGDILELGKAVMLRFEVGEG